MFKSIAVLSLMAGALVIAPPVAAPIDDEAAMQQTALNQAAQRRREQGRIPGARAADTARGRSFSPDMVRQCLEVAHDVDPALAEHLETLRQTRGEDAFERSIRRARHLVGLARLKERDPRLYDVKVQELQVDAKVTRTLEALQEARRDGSASVADLEAELHQLVKGQVSLSIASRGMYFRTLRDHVQAMEKQLDEEGRNFQRTVEERYRALLEEIEAAPAAELVPADAG